MLPSDEAILNIFGIPRQCKTEGEWVVEILLGEMQRGFGLCDLRSPDEGALAHITSSVLPESTLWEEL